jgi:hypothetical protein
MAAANLRRKIARFASAKTLFFMCFWIFKPQLQIDNSQLPGLPPVV